MVKYRYLLDTNILSEPLKPKPNPVLLEKMQEHQNELVTSATVWYELWYGAQRLPPSRKRNAIISYLSEYLPTFLKIFPYDERAANWHAKETARLEGIGKPTSFADGQIASVANVNNLILVTRNLKHFEYFEGILLENWILS